MAKKLSEIQVGVRHLARDSSLDLTTASNLEIVNRTYRFLVASLPFPEFRRIDVSTSTNAGSGDIGWPTGNIFVDVVSVEIQDGDDNDRYKLITSPVDEWTWGEAAHKKAQSVPDYYMRYYRDSKQAEYIEVRPVSKYSSKIIRITGTVEPTDLESSGSSTLFIRKTADDVLEHLVAADIVSQAGDREWAPQLINKAVLLLQQTFGKELVPEEMLRQVIQQ